LPFKINNLRNADYEHVAFFETCIIPLICFNLDSGRHIIVLPLIISIIGIIYLKMNMSCANPTLSLAEYRIYNANQGAIVKRRYGKLYHPLYRNNKKRSDEES
jgi:hypothetical protein